jgi:outer membrane protein OmpA-like peptidoglycan-associated protein
MKLTLIFMVIFGYGSNCLAQTQKDTSLEYLHTMIYFHTNEYTLDSIAKYKIRQLADTLKGLKDRIYQIESHTDSDGSIEFNKKLSDQRGRAVYQYLLDLKVDSLKIISKSYGKLKPEVSNRSDSGKAINRRVKLSLNTRTVMKLLRGNLESDNVMEKPALVRLSEPFFSDSVFSDNKGNFSIYVPVNRKLLLSVISDEFFFEPKTIVTRDEVFLQPLKIKVSSVKLNSVLMLKEINFIGGQAIVLRESVPSMEYLLGFMQSNKNLCFEVAGHINQPGRPIPKITGPAASQLKLESLSEKRAKTISTFLASRGIDSTRMFAVGYENIFMKFPEPKTEEEMKANRRVEIIIRDCNKVKKHHSDVSSF